MKLALRTRTLDLSAPLVMGVLNVTPDSFSDGARFLAPAAALAQARRMCEEGALILDVGGESTRPGAAAVAEQEELDRVVPVIEKIRAELDVAISVDTRKLVVMRAAAAAGAELINDVTALRAPGAVEYVAEWGLAACLMHMQGEPQVMQQAPAYGDVVAEVAGFLRQRIAACEAAGIARERLLIDPGIGFGKTLEHNLQLLANLNAFAPLGCPLLIGVSRKSMFQKLLGLPVERRVQAGAVTAALAVWQSAAIVRAHDVRETVEALRIARALAERRRS